MREKVDTDSAKALYLSGMTIRQEGLCFDAATQKSSDRWRSAIAISESVVREGCIVIEVVQR